MEEGKSFIFMDESGRPNSSSEYFAISLLEVSSENILKLIEHFSSFRYFQSFYKEWKCFSKRNSSHKNFNEIFSHLLEEKIIFCTTSYIVHNKYKGPYLNKSDFLRNFLLARTLERHFYLNRPSNNTELVIDCYNDNLSYQKDLFDYINVKCNESKKRLPKIGKIVHLDSRYCEGLQIVDKLVSINKDFILQKSQEKIGEVFSLNKFYMSTFPEMI